MTEQLEYPTAVTPSSAHEMTHEQAHQPDQPDDPETTAEKPIDDMSVEELQRRQDELAQKIREKREAEKKAVIEQIVNVVHTYDIPIDELVDALGGLKIKRKGVKATQKYRDPVTGITWSGRGKEPSWIRGKDRRKFLIPDSE